MTVALPGGALVGAFRAVSADVRLPPSPLEGGPLVAGRVGGTPAELASSARGRQVLLQGVVRNAQALASELGLPGRPRDEEVVAAALDRWDEAALDRLHGAWSVLVWDPRREAGVLAADAMGHETVHFRPQGDGLVFASALAVLLDALPSAPRVNRGAVLGWLASLRTSANGGLHDGVRRLRAGHLLRFGPAGWSVERWRTWAGAPPAITTLPAAGDALRRAVMGAIDRELRASDGEVGLRLSGGLDSGTVAVLADRIARDHGRAVRTYSAVFPAFRRTDEAALIDQVVDRLAGEHTQMVFGGRSLVVGALDFALRWRQPLAAPAYEVWRGFLHEARQDGVDLLLDGLGGDEVFGCSGPLVADRLRAGRPREALALVRRAPGAQQLGSRRRTARLLWELGVVPATGLPAGGGGLPPWLPRETRPVTRRMDRELQEGSAGPLWRRALVARALHGPDAFGVPEFNRQLTAVAGMVPAHPLHASDVLEAVLACDPELNFAPAFDRALLREVGAGFLPDAVRLRPGKAPFDEVVAASLRGWDLPLIDQLLGDGALIGAYVDLGQVRENLLAPARAGDGTAWVQELWRVVAMEAWLRAEADPDAVRALLRAYEPRSPEVRYERRG